MNSGLLLVAAFLAQLRPANIADLTNVDRLVGQAIRARYQELRRCYDLSLADDGTRGGTVALVVAVEPDGRVSAARVQDDQIGNARMAECLRRTLATFTIAGLNESVDVAIPLHFAPPRRQVVVNAADAPPRSILAGAGEARVLLDQKTVGIQNVALSRLTLQKDAVVSLHRHPGATEVIYVLQGSGCMRGEKPTWRAVQRSEEVV